MKGESAVAILFYYHRLFPRDLWNKLFKDL